MDNEAPERSYIWIAAISLQERLVHNPRFLSEDHWPDLRHWLSAGQLVG